ncbi:APC family permease [Gulosibacter sp. ACHW.36C]|uniref:APC family permease n=1 Tax=Gulosibacter sediminis TaxID=1729695 RepID=A0ABY4MY40_9MICO|nr:APC family permease [Gulosibacter sediminis]UQN15363.1 APC family permease [Gulosibacter sediminis]
MTDTTHLNRTLGLRSLVLFGLAYLTPMIVLGIFGVIASASAGASASAYLIALIAMLFTAASYGRLAARFPVAGSAYTYVGRSIDGRAGFLVGWAVLLDYLFLPMVIWLIGASYLSTAVPGVPSWVWIIAFILITTALNIIGIKVADRVNFVLMAFQFLVIAIFVVLSIASVVGADGADALVSASPFVGENAQFSNVIAAAAVAAYSFLGFDAVTTLTEETKNPQKVMPRAILLIALIGGGIFIVVTYFTQLVHPGGTFTDESSAAFEIAQTIGGNVFSAIFVAGLIIAQFTSGLAAQASGSRLLYAMGRDGVLPKRIFGVLHRGFQTPWGSIVVVGVVGLIAMFLDVATSTSFVNFGAFIAFAMVNISVIVLAVKARREGKRVNVLLDYVAPSIGAIVIIGLLTQLDSNALIIGAVWLVIGIVILASLTGGFRRQPPQVEGEAFSG